MTAGLFLVGRPSLLQSVISCPFQVRPIFVQTDMHNFVTCVSSFRMRSLMFIILLITYLSLFIFLLQLYINFGYSLSCNRVQVPCNFIFLVWLSLWMLCPVLGPFICRIPDYHYPFMELENILYIMLI